MNKKMAAVMEWLLTDYPGGPRSQRELAEKVGVGNGTIHRICKGEATVKRSTLEVVAAYYGLRVDVFEAAPPLDLEAWAIRPVPGAITVPRRGQAPHEGEASGNSHLQIGDRIAPLGNEHRGARNDVGIPPLGTRLDLLELVMIPELDGSATHAYPASVLGGFKPGPTDRVVSWSVTGAALAPWAPHGSTAFVRLTHGEGWRERSDGELCLYRWRDQLRAGRFYPQPSGLVVRPLDRTLVSASFTDGQADSEVEVVGVVLSALSAPPVN